MRVLTARFQSGRLDVPEGALHEGDTVTLLVPEGAGEGFTVTSNERDVLLRAIEQARRGEGVDGWELLDQLRD